MCAQPYGGYEDDDDGEQAAERGTAVALEVLTRYARTMRVLRMAGCAAREQARPGDGTILGVRRLTMQYTRFREPASPKDEQVATCARGPNNPTK